MVIGQLPSGNSNLCSIFEEKEWRLIGQEVPYILESNPHLFYSFRGLKIQMWIRFACGLDSRSRAGFWKND
jgi:hypothetical protein